ncbi:hypothetical protein BH09MYX1_BH09MYX1_38920 [soil metagenome]
MTRAIIVRRWEASNDEPLTEAAVRTRYASEKYRVSVSRYPAGTKLTGSTRQAICHVLNGVGRYEFESEVTIRCGDVAEFPGGQYSLEVMGDDEFVVIKCWELPFEFNRVQ